MQLCFCINVTKQSVFLILELLFLQRRGGCSLTVVLFFLMLVGTCCFVLSASLCVVRRLADRIKQHVPTSIRKKSTTVREQPPRLCKNNNSKIKKSFSVCQEMLPLFRAVLKFCSTNRLFKQSVKVSESSLLEPFQ